MARAAKKKPPPRPKPVKKTTKKKAGKKRAKKKTAKRSPSQRGKASREKGDRGERNVRLRLSPLWPDFDRNFQDRGGERDGSDLYSKQAMLDGEVKHRARTEIQAAIRDAIKNCEDGQTWFAVDWPTAGPRKKPVIVMELDGFIDLIKRERMRSNALGYADGFDEALEDDADENVVDLGEARGRRAALEVVRRKAEELAEGTLVQTTIAEVLTSLAQEIADAG